jgi:hypothetical protein
MTTLDIWAWGLAVGSGWGFVIFVIGVVSRLMNLDPKIIKLFARVYIGYKGTIPGSFIGAVWGFMDGAISGMLMAGIYNRLT